jgi:hypothetical protein
MIVFHLDGYHSTFLSAILFFAGIIRRKIQYNIW